MCGRYFLDPVLAGEALRAFIEAIENRTSERVKTGELCPGDKALVIARARTGKSAPFLMRWGYKPAKGRMIINARSETAGDSPMFAGSMISRRCLIPATAYFEWEKTGEDKIKQQISPENEDRFYLAGLYRYEEGEPVCVVLTRDAAPSVSRIHDRMPVMLSGDAAKAWLNPQADARMALDQALNDMTFHEAAKDDEK